MRGEHVCGHGRDRHNTVPRDLIELTHTCAIWLRSVTNQCRDLVELTRVWRLVLLHRDNRESLIEYDDDDRFERDTREANRQTTQLFSHAARGKHAPSLASLVGADVERAQEEGERALAGSRTMKTLVRIWEGGPVYETGADGDGGGDGGGAASKPAAARVGTPSKVIKPLQRPAPPTPAAEPPAPAEPPAGANAPPSRAARSDATLPTPAPLPPPSRAVAASPPSPSPADREWRTYEFGSAIPPLPSSVEVVWPTQPAAATSPPPQPTGVAAAAPPGDDAVEAEADGMGSSAPRSEITKDGPESSRRRRRGPGSNMPPPPPAHEPAPPAAAAAASSPLVATSDNTGVAKAAPKPLSIPGMPTRQEQSSAEPPSAAEPQPAAATAPPPMTSAPGAAKLPGAPPLLLGEFSADDVLLWLETTAFKKRVMAPLSAAATQQEAGGAREAQRQRILHEVRGLKRRVQEAGQAECAVQEMMEA